MNIDKRALREVAERATPGNWRRTSSLFNGITVTPFSLCGEEVTLAHTVEKRDAEFIAAANPATMLALLDENLQLQREKDAIEAVALALRDDMRQAREQLEEAEKRNAEQREYYEGVIADGSKRIAELEKGHQEAAKQINSWRRLAKQNIAERGKDISELEAARQRIAELEDAQCQHESDTLMLCHQFDELASAMGWTSELAMKQGVGQLEYARSIKARIAELEAKLETADKLQDSAFRDGLKAGFSYGQTDDQSGFAQCMSAYSTRAGIGVKQQEDSVDSDVGRNQPGMVVAVHIDAGDFVKFKGQVFEVEETDFDDHDVTLWFVGGNALKCAAGCQVEVVSTPVAAGIKVNGE
ncbi:protein Ead [Salmonella enterica subsp. enterica serovar Muenchen]|nr:protein Ead [Salmonella enterica subsp. enterica serovar Muenchen]